ncbi:cobalt/nickel transport system permease protein [Singulisphaera sp. GP187]|uniref:energy-coupling factor ABC transporter permease n=1 Tax=Singulisphaera sp. GP187 TaxID=1882752 RepID=UPI00092B9DC0|nr:energy-coupling factor ABC transporter permease [Singulisphaera sp. GP187]SIO46099.1 cobalt/nickel transport system permease protein [Singulisphaera sp. GP187]
MHIPDAVLDPKVAAATGVVAAAGMSAGLRLLESRLGERTTVLMGTMAAFVFAAQMVNFPIGPLPISGHLLGGVLSAVMLGPWAGAVVIGAVLIVQCLLFGDGGLTALGANFLNMGLIGAVGGYAIYAPIRRAMGGRAGVLLGAMVAAWFSVILASGAFAIELAFSSGWSNFFQTLSWMALVHAGIGLGEAIVTGLVIRFILLTRPDLVYQADETEAKAPGWGALIGAGLGMALAVCVFLAPFASEHPDGLEYVGEKLGFLKDGVPALLPTPIPDYSLPLLGEANVKAATAFAGLVGTLVVFAIGLGLARVFSTRTPTGVDPDAA